MAGNTPNPARRLESFTSNAIIWVEKIASLSPAKPLLDLGLGLMEVNPPGYVRDAYVKSLARQEVNQYGPSSGLPEFVQALAHFYSDLYKRTLNPNTEVSVHTGGSEALLCIIMAFIEHGDEVILIEPSFPLYELHIKFTGGTPVYVPLREPQRIAGHTDSNDWTLDLDEFKRAFTSKTKMVIVNTPHNPLGKIFSADELRAIGEICVDKGVVIVSDEVYEFANFELDPIPRTATISQAIGQHTLTVGSVGKAFNATGWRAGWVIGPESLIPLVKAAHIALCYVTPGPPQVAATAGFQEAEAQDFWRSNKLEMRGRLDVLCSILDEVGLRYSQPHSAYFLLFYTDSIVLPDGIEFPDDVSRMTRDCQICWWLVWHFGIVTIPGSAFYSSDHAYLASNVLRIVACKSASNLELARTRLLRLKPYVKRAS